MGFQFLADWTPGRPDAADGVVSGVVRESQPSRSGSVNPSEAMFVQVFERGSGTRAEAPGRVNLIGEHTDYHGGFVLPTVLPQSTAVHVRARGDGIVSVTNATLGGEAGQYALANETVGRGWLDYVQGVTYVLARRGFKVAGFDVTIESSLPLGASVSAAAALEVSLLRALRAMHNWTLDDYEIGLLAHEADTDFVGAPAGVMDHMACSLGRPDEALFLDATTLTAERVPLPTDAQLVVIDSGISHLFAGTAYLARRRESFAAAELLGVTRLRELDLSSLPRISRLPDALARRARHVVTENQRVCDAVEAMRAGDSRRLGGLLNASHASLRDDYAVTTDDIDVLVRIAQANPVVFGARMTGGGFGGCIVMLVQQGMAESVATDVIVTYGRETGRLGTVLLPS